MAFEDDIYADLVIEETMRENALNRLIRTMDNQKVLRDIQCIIYKPDFKDIPFAIKNRDIIETVKRYNGRMSEKQKWCFCRFLLDYHDDYEIDYERDHPFKVH